MKGVSVLVQDGKIADIGAKIVAPKGMQGGRRQRTARLSRA